MRIESEQFEPITAVLQTYLHAEAQECAAEMLMPEIAMYGRFAVKLLNQASAQGFTVNKTLFDSGYDESYHSLLLTLPSLVDTSKITPGRQISFVGPAIDKHDLEMYAARAQVTPAERVRRSIRFANFIVKNDGKASSSKRFRDFHFIHQGEDVWLES
jgi:hypothetical protein